VADVLAAVRRHRLEIFSAAMLVALI